MTTCVTSGKEARMTRAWFMTRVAFGGSGAGRQRAARPDGAFIQMRQEFGADDAAAASGSADTAERSRSATPTVTQRNRMAHAQRPAVALGHPGHHRIVPFAARACRRQKLESTGAISIEKISAPSSAKATVQAMGLNSRPSTRCSVKIGR